MKVEEPGTAHALLGKRTKVLPAFTSSDIVVIGRKI